MAAAANQLNELISRIDAADNQIDAVRAQIAGACETLDALFVSNHWDSPPALPDLDDEIAHMAQVIEHAGNAVAGQVGETLDQGAQTLREAEAELQSLMSAWDAVLQQALQQASAFEQVLRDSLDQLNQTYDELDAGISETSDALDQAETALDTAYGDWEQATSGEFAQKLEQRFRGMVEDLANNQTQKIEQHLSDAETQSGDAIEQLLSTGSQLVNELNHAIGETIEQLRQHIGEEIAQKLEEAARTIVETAIKEIMHSVIEAIATSQLGAEITAMMAPVLPELIAIKKITDAILVAIQLWKETLGRLNDPFDMF